MLLGFVLQQLKHRHMLSSSTHAEQEPPAEGQSGQLGAVTS